MKHRESPKRRLISGLHVLKQLIEEENSLPTANQYRERWQREFEKKAAELVALEIAAYRKKFKLDYWNSTFRRSVPTRLSPNHIEI